MWIVVIAVMAIVTVGWLGDLGGARQPVGPAAPARSDPTGAQSSATSPSPSLAATPVSRLNAVTGHDLTPYPTKVAWSDYINGKVGLRLRYPPTWTATEEPEQMGVILYPPGWDGSAPSPSIGFAFVPQAPYASSTTASAWTSEPKPISVAGVSGRQYEDAEYAVPYSSFYVDLPHRGGTLFITTTKGPYVSLVGQLQEILKTVTLTP